MTDDPLVYLRPEVRALPLVSRFYAWPHRLPPASWALHLLGRALPTLRAYLRAPAIHAAACADPARAGGRFVEVPSDRAGEVRALLDRIEDELAPLLALGEGLRALDELLATRADGGPLEPLYPEVPEVLRGMVELVYDRRGHGGYRLIEPLLYAGAAWLPGQHSVVLERETEDRRPFSLTTPRLVEAGEVELRRPFADPAYDLLFSTRTEPRPYRQLLAALGRDDDPQLRALLSPEAPPPPRPAPNAGLRVRAFGHACVLIEGPQTTILADPMVSSRPDPSDGRLTMVDLPARIDAALITHAHADHLYLETLLQLRPRISTLLVPRAGGGGPADPDLALMLRNLGFAQVRSVAPFEQVALAGAEITALPFIGEHGDLDIQAKATYLVRAAGRSLLLAADAVHVDRRMSERIRELCGPIDRLLISMECEGAPMSWLYGPVMTGGIDPSLDESRRLAGSDPSEAMAMAEALGCAGVWIYAMGLEPWMFHLAGRGYDEDSVPQQAARELISRCRAAGLDAQLLRSGWEGTL